MNREILFRGFAPDETGEKTIFIEGNPVKGDWAYGWYCMYPFGRWPCKDAIIPADKALNGEHCFVKVIPETVGQYTGKEDMRRQKIFEGDIHHATIESPISGKCEYQEIKHGDFFDFWSEVDSYGFYAATSEGVCAAFDENTTEWARIVGNIYENPELMEE